MSGETSGTAAQIAARFCLFSCFERQNERHCRSNRRSFFMQQQKCFHAATKILQTSGTARLLHGLSAFLSRFS